MEVSIKVVNVGDGDAVIVKVVDTNRKLVFLIDGGHSYDAKSVLEYLDAILETAGKSAPDFILCSHFDDDHIGGLYHIIDKYKEFKPFVWIHRTSEKISIDDIKGEILNRDPENGIQPSESDDYLSDDLTENTKFYDEILTTVQQEIDVLALLKQHGIPNEEPIAEKFKIEAWPELRLLSPTLEFYKSQFPDRFDVAGFLNQEIHVLKADSMEEVEKNEGCSSLVLKSSPVTATNLNSAILMLSIDGKKYLFSGDGGIDSFEAIPGYKEILEDLYFLKAPHHGSKNNINAELIHLMRPKIVFISGKRRISSDVISCFKSCDSTVFTTRDDGDLLFPLPN